MEKQLKAEFESLLKMKLDLNKKIKQLEEKTQAISINFESDSKFNKGEYEEKISCHMYIFDIIEDEHLSKLKYNLRPFSYKDTDRYSSKYEMYYEQDNIVIYCLLTEPNLQKAKHLLKEGQLEKSQEKVDKVREAEELLKKLKNEN